MSGAIKNNGNENHLTDRPIFHRGMNTIDQISNNMLVYDFDRPAQALALEAMGHYGDSGSGAYVDIDGTLYIAGVKSNGEDAFYGSQHEYTRIGGPAFSWVDANKNSLKKNVPADDCAQWPNDADLVDNDNNDQEEDNEDQDDYYDEECCEDCPWSDDECWYGCEYCEEDDGDFWNLNNEEQEFGFTVDDSYIDTCYCDHCLWEDNQCWDQCLDECKADSMF